MLNQARSESLRIQDNAQDDLNDLKFKMSQQEKSGIISLHNLSIDPFFIYIISNEVIHLLNRMKKKGN